MPFFHLRLSVSKCVPGTLLWPLFGYVVDCTHFQPSTIQSIFRVSVVKNVPTSLGFSSSFSRLHPCGALQMSVSAGEAVDSDEREESTLWADSLKQHNINGEVQLDSYSDSGETDINEHCKESQRRRKIGLANKGRVPWNKGRKHSSETREKIRQRTIEALRDPKVKSCQTEDVRMSPYSQSKAKIRSSLRRIWADRLKWKRSREKFYLSWAESIAKAAKEGGSDQQELDWDSYDKMKKEIALQQLQWAENKRRARELAKMRAERAARARAEKMTMLAEKRREHEWRVEARGEIKRMTTIKSQEDKEELAIAKGLKLKERLTKLHKKKSINGQIMSQRAAIIPRIPASEKLDLEIIKRERMQREVSLADQIHAAKSKRAQLAAREALSDVSPRYPFSERSKLTSSQSATLQQQE